MKRSEFFIPTLKEVPNDAVLPSHTLMLRAGLIRKFASGLYTFLPLGLKVLKKVENIVREEMDRAGGLEFLFPLLLPRKIFSRTGRWELFRELLFRVKDRQGSDLALAPTHEEAFTELFTAFFSSYRELPVILYQIGTKFRDELRPRFGVMRGKQFIMKDAYSFHLNDSSLAATYNLMRTAYRNTFSRMGLDFVNVNADSGAMGGSGSEEFMVKSDVGEEIILTCPECGYAANVETAVEKIQFSQTPCSEPYMEVHTPDQRTIEELTLFFNTKADAFIKSLIYEVKRNNQSKPVMILIRGDYDLNEVKLSNLFPGAEVVLASEEVIKKVTGAPLGFAGPVGIADVEIIADFSVKNISGALTGANKKDYHLKNVCIERDFTVSRFADLYHAREGGICQKCSSKLQSFHGIEVGHIFKLGKKYTRAFNTGVLDQKGASITPVMGCYGIGVDRTVAAVIEQNHDQNGIIWPPALAPFQINILSLNIKNENVKNTSSDIYNKLTRAGYDVLWDDRDERPGFKFKDADLIGIPVQIIIGQRSLQNGKVEVKRRCDNQKKEVELKDIPGEVKDLVKTL